jgi:hypothetical protein
MAAAGGNGGRSVKEAGVEITVVGGAVSAGRGRGVRDAQPSRPPFLEGFAITSMAAVSRGCSFDSIPLACPLTRT